MIRKMIDVKVMKLTEKIQILSAKSRFVIAAEATAGTFTVLPPGQTIMSYGFREITLIMNRVLRLIRANYDQSNQPESVSGLGTTTSSGSNPPFLFRPSVLVMAIGSPTDV